MHDKTLNKHEWIVVFSLVLLMAAITFVTHRHWFAIQPKHYSEPHYVYDQKIQVRIEGAVELPGTYELGKGAKVEDLLFLAKPAVNADLKKIVLTRKVRDGQTIHVPILEYITIYLEGAVERSGAFIVPKGTFLEDLLGLVRFSEGADLGKMRGKKRLKEGEIVKVAFQKNPSTASLKQKDVEDE